MYFVPKANQTAMLAPCEVSANITKAHFVGANLLNSSSCISSHLVVMCGESWDRGNRFIGPRVLYVI